MKIDHKESIEDFGNQFAIDSNIDDYWGSNEMLNVFRKCSFKKRNYIIFDQLNPSFSKYYKKLEVEELLKNSGFKKIKTYNRHNYSWFAIAEK